MDCKVLFLLLAALLLSSTVAVCATTPSDLAATRLRQISGGLQLDSRAPCSGKLEGHWCSPLGGLDAIASAFRCDAKGECVPFCRYHADGTSCSSCPRKRSTVDAYGNEVSLADCFCRLGLCIGAGNSARHSTPTSVNLVFQ